MSTTTEPAITISEMQRRLVRLSEEFQRFAAQDQEAGGDYYEARSEGYAACARMVEEFAELLCP